MTYLSTPVNVWHPDGVPTDCCPAVQETPLGADAAERLAAQPGGEACICDLTAPVALSQPTVSHHMRVLTDAGLLTREQRGKWAYYRLVPGALDGLAAALTATLASAGAS